MIKNELEQPLHENLGKNRRRKARFLFFFLLCLLLIGLLLYQLYPSYYLICSPASLYLLVWLFNLKRIPNEFRAVKRFIDRPVKGLDSGFAFPLPWFEDLKFYPKEITPLDIQWISVMTKEGVGGERSIVAKINTDFTFGYPQGNDLARVAGITPNNPQNMLRVLKPFVEQAARDAGGNFTYPELRTDLGKLADEARKRLLSPDQSFSKLFRAYCLKNFVITMSDIDLGDIEIAYEAREKARLLALAAQDEGRIEQILIAAQMKALEAAGLDQAAAGELVAKMRAAEKGGLFVSELFAKISQSDKK